MESPWAQCGRLTLILSALALALALALRVEGGTSAPTQAAVRADLGWRLMADRRLSLNGNMACLDCHMAAFGYADGKPVATADGLNTPTLYGLAARTTFGWFTPEVSTLEAFILRPLDNPREMGPLAETTLDRLRADPEARAAYAVAFPSTGQVITWERTAQAMAAAIRTIPSPPTGTLTPAAARGQALFAEVGCAGCHQGATLSSERYLNTGVSADLRNNGGQARVPSLIGLAQTAPYFHDGSAATLEDVVRFYVAGGRVPGPGVSRGVSPFVITDAEVADLVAFLSSR
ncbi:c-type cytochrome [Chloroflexales bacterium ZM16-3]|nr:c-type cytochrome [Chloroflexales bacterium ZM16-3]